MQAEDKIKRLADASLFILVLFDTIGLLQLQ